jgi:hypothetical protein
MCENKLSKFCVHDGDICSIFNGTSGVYCEGRLKRFSEITDNYSRTPLVESKLTNVWSLGNFKRGVNVRG